MVEDEEEALKAAEKINPRYGATADAYPENTLVPSRGRVGDVHALLILASIRSRAAATTSGSVIVASA